MDINPYMYTYERWKDRYTDMCVYIHTHTHTYIYIYIYIQVLQVVGRELFDKIRGDKKETTKKIKKIC